MSNNTVTLTSEIKKSLRPKNILLFTGIMFLCSVCSLLLLFALDPMAISKGITLAVVYTTFITGSTVGILLGMIVTVTVGRFYAPKVMRYVDAPNEIELIKDGIIALGSFVTTIENTINAKQIARIFYNISKQFQKMESRIIHLEENEINYNRIIAEQRRTIFDLKWEKKTLENQLKENQFDKELVKKIKLDLERAYSSIAKAEEKIVELENKIKELGDQ